MVKPLDSEHPCLVSAWSGADIQEYEEMLGATQDNMDGDGRAAQRVLLLRSGRFLVLREFGAPADKMRFGGSLGFPGMVSKEFDRNETWCFFQP